MKKLVKIVLVLVVLLVIAVFIALSMIDRIAKEGVQQGGTYALGVETTLDNISIAIFSGQCRMEGLKVANPAGFDSDRFLGLNAGQIEVSLGSLMEDTVVIPELTLTGIDLYLEKKGDKANYDVILENLKKFESQPDEASDDDGGKKFRVEQVLIRNVNIHIDVPPVKKTIPIEQIGPSSVGTDSDNGAVLAEVTDKIVKVLFKSIVQDLGNVLPGLADDLGKGLEGLSDIGDVSVKIADQVLKESLDLEKHIEGIKGAGKGLGDAVDGLGDLFKKDKKKK